MATLREMIGSCERCRLCETRTQAVPWGGDIRRASIILIGEGPGEDEDRAGLPFIGKSGDLLRKTLHRKRFPVPEVLITNIVKCRPPGNRDPKPAELEACWPWTERIIKRVRPAMIVAVGRISLRELSYRYELSDLSDRITKSMGQHRPVGDTTLYVLPHPAWIMRTGQYKLFDRLVDNAAKMSKLALHARRTS